MREKRERSTPAELNELCRELQTALGTAKWQVSQYTLFLNIEFLFLCTPLLTMYIFNKIFSFLIVDSLISQLSPLFLVISLETECSFLCFEHA